MKKILKITGIVFLVIIVLLVSLPFLFKDKLIKIAKEQANNNLNARVDFGEFDLSIVSSFPNFRFSINNVSVVGVNDFANDTLAYVKQFRVDVDVMSVIKGDKISVREIAINEPKINAIVLHDGKANWNITKPGTDTAKTTTTDTSKTKFKLSLKKFEITKAQISYNDMQGDMNAFLQDFDFVLSGDFTQDNFLLGIVSEIQKMNFTYGGVAYAKQMHIKLKADIDADMPGMKFTFKENEIGLNELALGIDGWVSMPDTSINLDIKFLCKQTEFKNILSLIPSVYSKDFASVQTAGKLALNGNAKGTYNASSLPAFGAHLEIADAMFKYPSLPKSVNNINVNVDVQNPNGQPDATVIDVHKFHVEMAGNPVDLTAHVKTPVSDPDFKAEVKGLVDLGSVKEFIPLDKGDDMSGVVKADVQMDGRMSSITNEKYEEFKAAGNLEVDKLNYKTASVPYPVFINELKLNFTPRFVELTSFDSKLGKSDVQMKGKIENFMQYIFQDSLIKGAFTLNSSLLDLNELMSSSTTATTTTAPDTAKSAPASTAATEVPRNIDFVLDVVIAKMLYDNMEITETKGQVVVRNARAAMTNLALHLLDGTIIMNGYYDTKDIRKPAINFNLNLNDCDIQKTVTTFNTVQKLAPVAKSANGKFTATLNDFTGILKPDMSPDLTTLTGHGVLQTKAVVIRDLPVLAKLDEALHLNKFQNITVNDVNISYEFKDGRVSTKPFTVKLGEIPTTINGSTGFDETLDYLMKMEVPTKILGAQGQQMAQGLLNQAGSAIGTNINLPEKVNITAMIGGTVSKPQVKLASKNNQQNAVEQVKETVINAVKDQVDKILADAQKQADAIKAEAAQAAQQVKDAGYHAADSLVNAASNPIAKAAAKKVAERMKKETDTKSQKILDEANAKADKILNDAKTKADNAK